MLSAFPLAFALLLPAPAARAQEAAPWKDAWAGAQAESAKSCRPVLLELGAPWCAACRAMESGVLSSERFRALSRALILVRVDVDGREGRPLQKRFLAPYLPTYLVLRPDGKELGRMAGWQPDGRFLARLSSWLKKSKEIPCKSSSSKT